jgi:hypothetical protein
MKLKKFEKKLTLNKKTVADLNQSEMNFIYGGSVTVEFKTCGDNCYFTQEFKTCGADCYFTGEFRTCGCPDPQV